MEKKTIYLEGPLAHASDKEAYDWREKFEKELSGKYILINPLKSVGDFRKELNELRARWVDAGARAKFKDMMDKRIIQPDLDDIARTDIEVAYIPKKPTSFGTICGFFYFKRILGKSPAILITGEDKTIMDCNNWELGLADEVFHTFDDAITYLKNKP